MFSRENILYGIGGILVSASLVYSGYRYGGRNTNSSSNDSQNEKQISNNDTQ